MTFRGFVAVHGGAGYHSPANSEIYKRVCQQACQQAVELLKEGKSALDAVTAAIINLEDSPLTNAGTGSNLTIEGTVECDASIMDGSCLQYGAVGAVSGMKNPILVAESLLRTQKQGTMSLGRVPPCTMVGHGAVEWARKNDIPILEEGRNLVTDASRKAFLRHKRKLDLLHEDRANNHLSHKHRKVDPDSTQITGQVDALHDTVGAVCVDHDGCVVSAVSSGGIVLKQPGRLGQAAIFGCGCWAENLKNQTGVGVSTSGCGEHLTKTLLAKECADCLKTQPDPTQAISDTFQHKFLNSPLIQNVDQKLGGALAVKVDSVDPSNMEVEVLWGHTTDSMCLSFMSTGDTQPKALISRLPKKKKVPTATLR